MGRSPRSRASRGGPPVGQAGRLASASALPRRQPVRLEADRRHDRAELLEPPADLRLPVVRAVDEHEAAAAGAADLAAQGAEGACLGVHLLDTAVADAAA